LSQTDAYFYFDFNDSRKSKAEASVRAMIAQLLCQTTHISPALENLFTQSRDGAMQPLLADLLIVLSQMIQEFTTAYLIIDALDECTELDDMLGLFLRIKALNNKHLHVMTTSRWNTETENCLSNIATAILCLDQRAMDRDISLYSQASLKGNPAWHNGRQMFRKLSGKLYYKVPMACEWNDPNQPVCPDQFQGSDGFFASWIC
jgi:hypothetical protein